MAIMSTRGALLLGNVLTIDSTLRTITIPEKICNLGVETDANVQRLRFSMPRYYDTVDLADFSVRINYQNAKGEGDVYAVTDTEAAADTITFSWLVGPNALACTGKVKFIVCLKKLTADGTVAQAYHTTVASLPVLEGLETCEHIVEEHPDVLEQILLRLDNLEKNGTGSTTPGPAVASGVTYLESPDAAGNYLYLRDLETGPYVLAGYFRPYEGSSHSLGFSNAIVNVAKKDAGTHVMVLSPLNGIINFLEILVDETAEGGHTYTRTNIKLPEVWEHVENGVKRIISNATDGYTNLRDLTSGVYILDGYFPMYEGAASRLAFGGTLANVAADDTGSHILAMSTVNGKMDFVTIEVDDTQESGFATSRTNISLPEMWAHTSNGIQYVESLDESNLVNLRDLTDGPYILYGYFHPYEGAPDTIPFDRAFASVINLSAGSHIMVYNPRNFKFDCYEVLGNATDGYTYTLENIGLLDMHQRVAALEGRRYPDWSHLKWYVMGDSLTAQENTFAPRKYYDFIHEKTNIQIIVDGIGATGYKNGEDEGKSFLDRVKNIPEGVDVVTIFGSGNDLKSDDFEYANRAIYDTMAWLVINRPDLRVIVVPPAPWSNYDKRSDPWKAYVDRMQTCALACDHRYVSDMFDCPPFNGKYESHMAKFFTTDPNGVHPNEEGHKALAPYFYNALLQELALKV